MEKHLINVKIIKFYLKRQNKFKYSMNKNNKQINFLRKIEVNNMKKIYFFLIKILVGKQNIKELFFEIKGKIINNIYIKYSFTNYHKSIYSSEDYLEKKVRNIIKFKMFFF